jgi:hypothetical protein
MHQHEQACRLPYCFWVGVTGHRELPPDPALTERVREVLGLIRRALVKERMMPSRLGVVSSLAEGADRVVADEVLAEKGARLEASLAFPREEYLRDFTTAASREEFLELLGQASAVTMVPDTGRRDETYAEAGRLTADRCDALVTNWDGARSRGAGDTADVVDHARKRGVPIYWIRTDDDGKYDIVGERVKGVPSARLREVHAYNHEPVGGGDLAARVDAEADQLRASAEQAGLAAELVEPSLRWYLPFLVRADALSLRLRSWPLSTRDGLVGVSSLRAGEASPRRNVSRRREDGGRGRPLAGPALRRQRGIVE